MEGGQLGDLSRMGLIGSGGSGSGGDGDSLGRGREDENDSRSGSDNVDGASGDELDPDNSNPRKKKKRYHRHTPQQIQELEAYVARLTSQARQTGHGRNLSQIEFLDLTNNCKHIYARAVCSRSAPTPTRSKGWSSASGST